MNSGGAMVGFDTMWWRNQQVRDNDRWGTMGLLLGATIRIPVERGWN